MSSGVLVLDNNCYSKLNTPERLDRFRANLRVSDFIAWPSMVNLVEATSAPSDAVRDRLFRTIRVVGEGRPLLPWPFAHLKRIGRAILDGESEFDIEPSGKEWYLEDLGAAKSIREEALAFQRGIETKFAKFHADKRVELQKKMRARGLKEDFESARQFLEREWIPGETRRVFAEVTWTGLGLPGEAPIDALEADEAWRLLLDVEGVATYERAIAKTQPKMVQRLDLIQLIYLAGERRRMIATADEGLLRVANLVLAGRYPNARATNIADLLL